MNDVLNTTQQPRFTNRLIHETSPYLLQHAHNPVDWYAWGPEPLARARAEDKPILLSVGYAACHWCHVMAHESFENERVAAIMNMHYICIKVDREERPDIDALYMDAVQAITGQGGWPMTVFLTPEGLPFFGGTYFPPEDRHGLPAFSSLLLRLAQYYKTRRAEVEVTVGEFREFYAQRASLATIRQQDPQTRVFVGDLPDLRYVPYFFGRDPVALDADVQAWNAAIAQACADNGATLLDINMAWGGLSNNQQYISQDGLHPSSEGAQALADYFSVVIHRTVGLG